jgi:competence protein ComEC
MAIGLKTEAARRWLVAQFQGDLPRQAVWAPVFFGAGIAVYFAAPVEPPVWSALVALAALALWVTVNPGSAAGLAFAAGAVFWAAAGFAAGTIRTWVLSTPVLAAEMNGAIVQGRVEQILPLANGQARIVLNIVTLDGEAAALRARILLRKPGAILPGAWISLRAGLRPPPGPALPGGFDFGRALWFQGIGASGFALGAPRVIAPLRPLTWPERAADALSALRRTMSARILAAVPGANGPVATAFLTGERTAIDEETMAAYRDSSLAHVLSISGLHMVMAGFGFFAGLRLILAALPGVALRYPVKKIAACGALVASFGYLMISGAATPTVRAFVMIALVFAAMLLDRPGLALRNVALAALMILLVAPESLLDVSFQMSFAAVAALVAAFEWWSARAHKETESGWIDRVWAWVAGAAMTSVIAGLATAPFSAFHFHRVTDYGVIANMLALPAVSLVVMPAGVVALLAMPLGFEAWPLAAMDWGLSWVSATAFEVASWPGAAHATAAFSPLSLMVMTIGGVWLCIWQMPWRWVGAAVIGAGAIMSPFTNRPDIYVAQGGRMFAVRDQDGLLAVPRLNAARFAVEAWLKANGENPDLSTVKARSERLFDCARDLCVARPDWGAVTLAQTRAPSAACVEGVVVIGPFAGPKPCDPKALILTPEFLASAGAIALTREGDAWRIKTVAAQRGRRPWVPGRPEPLNTGE